MSAYLGKTRAARVQPANILDPSKPISAYDLHARSNDSYQLRREFSASQTVLLYKLVSQKYVILGFYESEKGMHGTVLLKS